MFENNQIIIILFNNGPGAEKKVKRYKVVAFPTLLTMIVCYIKIHLKSDTIPLSAPPHMMSGILSWSS